MRETAFYIPVTVKRHRWHADVQPGAYVARRHAFGFVAGGEGLIRLNEFEYKLAEGACFFVSPGDRVRLSAVPGEPMDVYYTAYAGYRVKPGADGACRDPRLTAMTGAHPVLRVGRKAKFATLLDALVKTESERDRIREAERQAAFQELLRVLLEEQTADDPNENRSIRRTMEYLDLHFPEPVDLGGLSDLAGLTPSSYCRAFKRVTGVTPGEYLTRLRIDKARELLRRTNAPLKDIAQSVGFADELYFSRVFKKKLGLSPRGYRRTTGKRIAIVSHLFLQDHLLSLGVRPVAAPSFPSTYGGRGFPSYLEEELKETVALNAEARIDPRQLTALEPDLIVKMSFTDNPTDESWARTNNLVRFEVYGNWNTYLRELAGLVGREAEAEFIEKNMETAEREARDWLRPYTRSGRWAIIRVLPYDFRLYIGAQHAITDLFYRALGFEPCRLEPEGSYVSHALGQLAELDPDRILIVWSDPSAVARLESNPLWTSLRAVRAGKVHMPDSVEWDSWGPIGRKRMIRACADYFSKLV